MSESSYIILIGKPKERGHFGNVKINGRILLQYI
jgi:hypothetical protein